MKLLFKNKTTYTKKNYDEFLAFHRSQYRMAYIFYTAIVLLAILFCIGIQLQYHNLTLAIVFCIALTCFFLWRLLHPISEVEKEYKSQKIQKQQEYVFHFYEKYFTIEDEKQISKIYYYSLYRIFETTTFFYLYQDKTHAFLINKATFIRNKAPQFHNFFHKKYWWKYRNKQKR